MFNSNPVTKLLYVLLITVFVLPVAALAATCTFTGGGDGVSWSDGANWDNGVPVEVSIGDGADTAVINGGFDVVVDRDVLSISSLTIDGDATVTIADGLTLKTNGLNIINGGLILGSTPTGSAMLDWAKSHRGSLVVDTDGYIAGSGTVKNLSSYDGVVFRSERSGDFDMTDIDLLISYKSNLTVCSEDLGRDTEAGWAASNYAFKSVSFTDRRFSHVINAANAGNVLYCGTLNFSGYVGETSNIDIDGRFVFAHDAVNFVNGNTVDMPSELTVYPALDVNDPFTAIWDDSADPGRAYVGLGLSPNDPPVADAGIDQSVMDSDINGTESFTLDGSASYDGDGTIVSYDWSENSSTIATGVNPNVTLAIGEHNITLTVTDDDGATATDTVVLIVEDPNDLYPPSADAGADQVIEDADDNGSQSVTLNGTASSDVGTGTIVNYSWTVDGSEIATGASPSVDFAIGTHEVTLTVTDNHSQTDTDTVLITITQPWIGNPVTPIEFSNSKSGISVSLTGSNGQDWAVEQLYHDPSIGDQLIYINSDVLISLAHSENNTIMNRDVGLPGIIGVNGPDNIPNSGDEGEIHWKVDRDMQSHGYNNGTSTIPDYAPLYSSPIDLASLTYDGVLPVLGTVGDNGEPYGSTPRSTTARFAYGQNDEFGNEWHTLTYWDDDSPIYAMYNKSAHRQGASDGHWVYICVDPQTPILQFNAPAGEEYYTTPLKTYFIPKTWEQTTYLTGGVQISMVNIKNDQPVFYSVDGGPWQQYRSEYVTASDIASGNEFELSARIGIDGPVISRTIVMDPETPAQNEQHGYLLWADEAEKLQCVDRLTNTQPFARSYSVLADDYYQSYPASYSDARGGWRSGASMVSSALSNAFIGSIDGTASHPDHVALAKTRLLRMARLEAVGGDADINTATPSKDYLNELSQTMQLYADAGVAYDLLASFYRSSDHPNGMTPIEELLIRDSLGEIAKTILQFRDNWSYTSGSGDTHWAHGFEQAVGIIAASMPTYATPYFGVSGADMTTVNDLVDADGFYYNPFPDQGATWWECATDSEIELLGYPNNRAPLRAEFLTSDDGFWTGPNDLSGDGDRYYTGIRGRQLVDIKYGGMASAQCRVELVEMAGYESPFPTRLHVLDFIRRVKGDDTRQQCVTNYIRRRQMAGYVTYSWDSVNGFYVPNSPRVDSSLCAFNDYYEGAALDSSKNLMAQYILGVKQYYGYEPGTAPDYISGGGYRSLISPYALALCWDVDELAPAIEDVNHRPIIKPIFKYVIEPDVTIRKPLYIMDLDDDDLTISVTSLPSGAAYNSLDKVIEWTPTAADIGVHIARVSADDGEFITTRPFPIIVMSDVTAGSVPAGPQSVLASLDDDDVTLTWSAPSGVDVSYYVIYKDGALIDVVPAGTTNWSELNLPAGSHTRYHVALYDQGGHESFASTPTPSFVSVGRADVPRLDGDADLDGDVDIFDFLILKNYYGTASDATWLMGDFDGDGDVDIMDFLVLKRNYGNSSSNVGIVTEPIDDGSDNDGGDDDDGDDTQTPVTPPNNIIVDDNDDSNSSRLSGNTSRVSGGESRMSGNSSRMSGGDGRVSGNNSRMSGN